MASNEHKIRELAYYLWLSEGKPEGQSDRHWEVATKMVAEQNEHDQSSKRSIDPSEAKGTTEPEQPDQT
jgi:hypothetical protein